MAVIFACGFESGSLAFYQNAGFTLLDVVNTAAYQHRTLAGNGGNYVMRTQNGTNPCPRLGVTTGRYLHFYIYKAGASDFQTLFYPTSSATETNYITVNQADGFVRIYKGGGLLLTTSAAVVPQWTVAGRGWWFAIYDYAREAADGGEMTVWVDGAQFATTGPGVDVRNGSVDYFDCFAFYCSVQWLFFDDVLLTDAAGGRQAEWYAVPLIPSANSAVMMTPSAGANWQCVGDIPALSASYVYADALLETDSYVTANLAVAPSSILTVVGWGWAARDGSITQIRLGRDIGGGPTWSAYEPLGASPNLEAFWNIWDTDPGGGAWSSADLDALILHAQFN